MHPRIKFQDLTRLHASIGGELNDAFQKTLATSAFIQGAPVVSFEKDFAAFTGSQIAFGVANGTDALEMALEALGIGRGDCVLVPSMTFAATAEAVVRQGATPVFAEVDDKTLCVTASTLKDAFRNAPGKVKGAIIVHLYGRACEIEAIQAFCTENGVALIEDCAQAHGARFQGRPVGSFGSVATYSFYPGKNLGALGDGGAVTTNDPKIGEQIRLLRDHGRVGKYDHQVVGRNSRLDALQASFLSIKLRHLPAWNAQRGALARQYAKALEGVSGIALLPVPMATADHDTHVFHLLVARVPSEKGKSREGLIKYLSEQGVEALIHYPVPLHLSKAFESYKPGVKLDHTELACREIVSLPMDPLMTPDDVLRVCDVVKTYLGSAT